VQRFGCYVAIEQPGHGWHWPWPIETMTRLNIANIPSLDSKALMLTADQSLIDLSWSVQYRISDPLQYLFQVRDPEATLREVSESGIRALAGSTQLQALLSGDARARITTEARARIQKELNAYGAGISLTGINLTDVHLPDAVLAAQRDADKAAEDRQRALTDAQTYASDILAKAQSATQRQLADAQVYAAQTEANADAEAQRFTQLLNAYVQAPEVTRNRLYIDTMEGILSRSRKIVVDVKSGTGNLIYLPLDKLAEEMRTGAVPGAPANNAGSAAAGSTAAPAGAAAASAPAAAGAEDDRGRERTER
jgi:membrane protease subunit HflK